MDTPEQAMKKLKDELIKEIIGQLEILAPDIMKGQYIITKTIQLTELTFEQLGELNRTYWQQIEAKTGEKIPDRFKYAVDYRLN